MAMNVDIDIIVYTDINLDMDMVIDLDVHRWGCGNILVCVDLDI